MLFLKRKFKMKTRELLIDVFLTYMKADSSIIEEYNKFGFSTYVDYDCGDPNISSSMSVSVVIGIDNVKQHYIQFRHVKELISKEIFDELYIVFKKAQQDKKDKYIKSDIKDLIFVFKLNNEKNVIFEKA